MKTIANSDLMLAISMTLHRESEAKQFEGILYLKGLELDVWIEKSREILYFVCYKDIQIVQN